MFTDGTGTRYLLEGACVPFCPSDRYKENETARCEECDETCETCKGPDVNDCTKCFEGFVGPDTRGFCIESEDRPCSSKCKECIEASNTTCSSCNQGQYLYDADCVDNCPDRYFQDENKSKPNHAANLKNVLAQIFYLSEEKHTNSPESIGFGLSLYHTLLDLVIKFFNVHSL